MKYSFLKSYSKINLFLDVGKRNKKLKLHNIKSLIFLIKLFDEIKIKKIYGKKDKISFSGIFAKYVKKNNNTVLQSLSMLRDKGLINPNYNYDIDINKKIPVFSGLGGGSSNSATIIKYFLNKKKLSKKELEYFSSQIGSDLKLFFQSNQLLQKNLKKIVNIKKRSIFILLLFILFLSAHLKKFTQRLNLTI